MYICDFPQFITQENQFEYQQDLQVILAYYRCKQPYLQHLE